MEPRETIDGTVAAGAVEAREMVAPPTRAAVRPAQGPDPLRPQRRRAAAMAGASYVYVLGQIEERYPRPSVERGGSGHRACGNSWTGGRRPFIKSCRNAKAAISRGNCAGC